MFTSFLLTIISIAYSQYPSYKSLGITLPIPLHSHITAIYNNKLFVFGGQTGSTYNDRFWSLDLTNKITLSGTEDITNTLQQSDWTEIYVTTPYYSFNTSNIFICENQCSVVIEKYLYIIIPKTYSHSDSTWSDYDSDNKVIYRLDLSTDPPIFSDESDFTSEIYYEWSSGGCVTAVNGDWYSISGRLDGYNDFYMSNTIRYDPNTDTLNRLQQLQVDAFTRPDWRKYPGCASNIGGHGIYVFGVAEYVDYYYIDEDEWSTDKISYSNKNRMKCFTYLYDNKIECPGGYDEYDGVASDSVIFDIKDNYEKEIVYLLLPVYSYSLENYEIFNDGQNAAFVVLIIGGSINEYNHTDFIQYAVRYSNDITSTPTAEPTEKPTTHRPTTLRPTTKRPTWQPITHSPTMPTTNPTHEPESYGVSSVTTNVFLAIVIELTVLILILILGNVIKSRNKSQQKGATEYNVELTVNKINDTMASNVDYVPLSDDQQTDQLIHKIHNYRTKYGVIGQLISSISLIFCIGWISYIIFTFFSYGITSNYCTDGRYICDSCYLCADGQCYNSMESQLNGSTNCYDESVSVAPFVGKILLICLNLYFIYLLFEVIMNGVEIYNEIKEEEDIKKANPSFTKKILLFKEKIESKRIDCRKYIYKETDNDSSKTAIRFLERSFILMQIFKLIEDSPNIILNLVSGNTILQWLGIQVLIIDIANILNTLYWNFGLCPCCNCRCSLECCCTHFPEHHVPYVRVTAKMIQFVCLLQFFAGFQQISAVSNIDVSNEFHLWLLYLNFLSGINGVIGSMVLYWTYYYQLCFYWSRNDVNKYENYVILDKISAFFIGGYIFQISIDRDKDKFIRVDPNETVPTKIYHEWNCFSCYLYCYFFLIAPGIAAVLIHYSTELNGDISTSSPPF